MFCEYCTSPMQSGHECRSCELYNAAVRAQKAAALSIATDRGADTDKRYWLNEHGVYGWLDGAFRRVGTAAEAAPFAALTERARAAADAGGKGGA